jgi:hypothetical protein
MTSIQSARKWHLLLVWPALISILIYTISALTHPLMAWTGPQVEKRYPPKLEMKRDSIQSISTIVRQNNLSTAKIAKFIPFKDQILFQITEDELTPRRYFSTTDFNEIIGHDQNQAIWLGHYYLTPDYQNKNTLEDGKLSKNSARRDIKNIEFLTTFNSEYPAVNRLLPVYKITYDTDDHLSIFIHTETQAVASITNDWKRALRTVFQLFHTFSWLDDAEILRLILIITLVGIITTMAITSFIFIIRINRKGAIKDVKRRWHRRIAYVVTIPLFLFSISGIYHLLHSSLSEHVGGLRLSQSLDLKNWKPIDIDSSQLPVRTTQISLVNIPSKLHNSFNQVLALDQPDNNRLLTYPYYRISSLADNTVTGDVKDNKNTREKRFKGSANESSVRYLYANNHATTTKPIDHALDKILVLEQAKSVLNTDKIQLEMITHFGPKYDFRNKRLPVWMATSESGTSIFIDPVSHILVDSSNMANQIEGYSFSFLHKWSVFTPLMGRFKRDVLIMGVLTLTMLMAGFGLLMHLKNRQKKKAH